MKKTLSAMWSMGLLALTVGAAPASVSGNDVALKFDSEAYRVKTLRCPDGKTVSYRAYEHIYYVTNVEDSTYQYLNFYVPEAVCQTDSHVPILLRTYVGGYMAARAVEPDATDATGRALSEGYAVCIPGSRGSNAVVTLPGGEKHFTGRAPAGLLDLKAAVRYLHYNDALMPGDAERIVTDGTSAGGAMSSLLGATGNHPLYAPLLQQMGAADARDDVFAAVCYCPITDLEHADMAYEWLYGCTNGGVRGLDAAQMEVSAQLAAAYPAYLESLGLRNPADGTLLTAANYPDYLKHYLKLSAQRACNEGCDIPRDIGICFYQPEEKGGRRRPQSEVVTDIDLEKYLNYVVTTHPLKSPPAFDQVGVLDGRATPENSLFGDARGSVAHFTLYSLRRATANPTATLPAEVEERVRLLNPMNFIGDTSCRTAPHWYIRHGARDRDTAFQISVNLATRLMNLGYDVDFALPWNRPHSGDYHLDDLFRWLQSIR